MSISRKLRRQMEKEARKDMKRVDEKNRMIELKNQLIETKNMESEARMRMFIHEIRLDAQTRMLAMFRRALEKEFGFGPKRLTRIAQAIYEISRTTRGGQTLVDEGVSFDEFYKDIVQEEPQEVRAEDGGRIVYVKTGGDQDETLLQTDEPGEQGPVS